jgi:hypothetical protein
VKIGSRHDVSAFRIFVGDGLERLQVVRIGLGDRRVLAEEAFEVGGGGDGLIEARVAAFAVGAERDQIALLFVGGQSARARCAAACCGLR